MQNDLKLISLTSGARLRAGVTTIQHGAFDLAFKFFNNRLFEASLPDCLITLQRKNGALGYFHSSRFNTRDGLKIVDEIALNPATFESRTDEQVLGTLTHEMVHCWQTHFGNMPQGGVRKPKKYHDREWAQKMEKVGLIPSDTGRPNGKKTGHKMTHYIAEEGAFARACTELLELGFRIAFVEGRNELGDVETPEKSRNKTAYRCGQCGCKAWGAPLLLLDCGLRMAP